MFHCFHFSTTLSEIFKSHLYVIKSFRMPMQMTDRDGMGRESVIESRSPSTEALTFSN